MRQRDTAKLAQYIRFPSAKMSNGQKMFMSYSKKKLFREFAHPIVAYFGATYLNVNVQTRRKTIALQYVYIDNYLKKSY